MTTDETATTSMSTHIHTEAEAEARNKQSQRRDCSYSDSHKLTVYAWGWASLQLNPDTWTSSVNSPSLPYTEVMWLLSSYLPSLTGGVEEGGVTVE